MAAVAGDEVKIDNIIPHHLEALIAKLREMGVDIEVHTDHVIVRGRKEMKAVDFKTSTYPGLATDLQQPLVTLLTQATGVGMVTDQGNSAIVQGPSKLSGARVKATDLRAGASLVIAGLIADGVTEIGNTYHIDRGYSNIEDKLNNIGAKVWREDVTE